MHDLLNTPNEELAEVLTIEIIRNGAILYNSHLSDLKDTETFLENIPAQTTYTYDIKVVLDDVGNIYQSKQVSFDLGFGWLKSIPPQVLGESIGPKVKGATITALGLPQTGANTPGIKAFISIIAFLSLMFVFSFFSFLINRFKELLTKKSRVID